MIDMNKPGFAAEASLYRSACHYYTSYSKRSESAGAFVVTPQQMVARTSVDPCVAATLRCLYGGDWTWCYPYYLQCLGGDPCTASQSACNSGFAASCTWYSNYCALR